VGAWRRQHLRDAELESDDDKTFNVMADETPMGKPLTRLVDI